MIKTADSEGGDQFCAGGEPKYDARLSLPVARRAWRRFFLLACIMPTANHFWHRFVEASQKQQKRSHTLVSLSALAVQLQALVCVIHV